MWELAEKDHVLSTNFLWLNEVLCSETVEWVQPHIKKQTTRWREPLDFGLHVAITLLFLATGNSYKSLDTAFHVMPYTISLIIPEACHAIIAAYGDEVMKLSATSEDERW